MQLHHRIRRSHFRDGRCRRVLLPPRSDHVVSEGEGEGRDVAERPRRVAQHVHRDEQGTSEQLGSFVVEHRRVDAVDGERQLVGVIDAGDLEQQQELDDPVGRFVLVQHQQLGGLAAHDRQESQRAEGRRQGEGESGHRDVPPDGLAELQLQNVALGADDPAAVMGGPADRTLRHRFHPQQAGIQSRAHHNPEVAAARLHGPAGQVAVAAGDAAAADGRGKSEPRRESAGRNQEKVKRNIEAESINLIRKLLAKFIALT